MAKPDTAQRLANLRAFSITPSFYAIEGQINGDLGQLPAEWQERYRTDVKLFTIAYMVMSYQTPIAWVLADIDGDPHEVVIPNVFYSTTTAKHQSACKSHLPFSGKRVTELA